MTLALQNHPPIIETPADMLRMIREVGSPWLKACLDAPLANQQAVSDLRHAVHEVGALQILSHFGGEYEQDRDGRVHGYVRQRDGSLTPDDFSPQFIRGLLEIGYQGYLGYELCHPLPKVNGSTVGIDFVDRNARLAAAYMASVIADARSLPAVPSYNVQPAR